MSDMFSAANSWLEAQRKAHLSRTVTYTSGSVSEEVLAMIVGTQFEVLDDFGREAAEWRDFIVAVADLPVFPPTRGDEISETRESDSHTYKVMAPGGMAEWSYVDSSCLSVRIHTKRVGG